jgi:hypothetical protein
VHETPSLRAPAALVPSDEPRQKTVCCIDFERRFARGERTG